MERIVPNFDLHLHSYFSDGRPSPSEVVKECKKLGLKIISLTDHENVDGIPEAVEMGKKLGIKVIPGIEFSVSYKKEEHHILGYFIDYRNLKLKAFLEKWQKTKRTQIKKTIRKLREFGFKISFEEVMAQVQGSAERPHISRAIFQNPEKNLAVLESWGIKEERAFFKKFLLEKPLGEGLAYVKRKKPEIQEVIDLIQALGGMAFWAHPLWKVKDVSKARERAVNFRKIGLDGIEICYPFHAKEQTLGLHQIAQDLSMHESGGSDAHGEEDSLRKIANFQTFGIKINFPF